PNVRVLLRELHLRPPVTRWDIELLVLLLQHQQGRATHVQFRTQAHHQQQLRRFIP
ncbi:unnamed protein product, partial [Pylaiella littoralis]